MDDSEIEEALEEIQGEAKPETPQPEVPIFEGLRQRGRISS